MSTNSKIRSTLSQRELSNYIIRQLNSSFPDTAPVQFEDLMPVMQRSFERIDYCFAHINNKYFFDGQHSVFNHLHGDQYAMCLYFIANELFKQNGDLNVCNKLFLLNKTLHACDIYFEVALPDIFLLVHPLGTVLGRGVYDDYFVAYQRVGVGANRGIYPRLGRYVTLRPGATVLGCSVLGDNCEVAAESLVLDRVIPERTTYIGRPSSERMRINHEPYPVWRKPL